MESSQRLQLLHELGVHQGRFQSKFIARHEPKTRRTKRVRRAEPWESLFMRKSRAEKRDIILKPWEYPMAAQNLAAILIQKQVRGMLCRLRAVRLHRRRSSAAATLYVQSPMQRFVSSGRGRFGDDAGFRSFTATRLQAWVRMVHLRWAYALARFPLYHIAALQLQYAWKAHCQHKLFAFQQSTVVPPRLRAVRCIQAVWKRYTHRRIFRYYRDLIAFQHTGDPATMLRAINPSEAALLDASMGAHVRFRLGGVAFPPTIYYKIYTRRAVCDVNAFSPKDYTLARQTAPHSHSNNQHQRSGKSASRVFIRVGNAYYRTQQTAYDTRNWYQRIEHNGWRPVTAKVVSDATSDPVAKATAAKTAAGPYYHFAKSVRKQDAEKLRRTKKRAWMHKLYTQGLIHEVATVRSNDRRTAHHQQPQQQHNDSDESDIDDGRNIGDGSELLDPATIFDVDFANDDWEDDAEDMFEWATALDYDAYVANWHELGKTASTDQRGWYVESLAQ